MDMECGSAGYVRGMERNEFNPEVNEAVKEQEPVPDRSRETTTDELPADPAAEGDGTNPPDRAGEPEP
jgi:hypothetical protein